MERCRFYSFFCWEEWSSCNLPETLVIGIVSVAAQSLWHSRLGVRLVQIAFSMATIAIAITATDFAYHASSFLFGPLRLFIAVSVFFVTNTFPIAVVVALTEKKDLQHVWSSCYLWCFPYYLVGAGVVSAFTFSHGVLDWQAAVVAAPIIYVIYKCYRLYLNRLTIEQERAEEEHEHATQMAALHEKAVSALNSSIMANARLDAVFRASPLAIITLDGVGRITGWNAMAERIFGWSAEEVLGLLFRSRLAEMKRSYRTSLAGLFMARRSPVRKCGNGVKTAPLSRRRSGRPTSPIRMAAVEFSLQLRTSARGRALKSNSGYRKSWKRWGGWRGYRARFQ